MPKQNISIGTVKMNKSSMELNQTLSETGQSLEILTKSDYAQELEKAIVALSAVKSRDAQVIDAITDITDALKEVKKPNPAPSIIRRFLNNAAAILNDVKDFVAPAAATAVGLKTLIDILPQIFK